MKHALRICNEPGCPQIATDGGKCAAHQAQRARTERTQRPTPNAQGYGRQWQRIRARFLRRYPVCVMCGAYATDVDHVTAKRNGGTDDDDNLQALCHACHSRKTAREVGWGGKRGMAG